MKGGRESTSRLITGTLVGEALQEDINLVMCTLTVREMRLLLLQ